MPSRKMLVDATATLVGAPPDSDRAKVVQVDRIYRLARTGKRQITGMTGIPLAFIGHETASKKDIYLLTSVSAKKEGLYSLPLSCFAEDKGAAAEEALKTKQQQIEAWIKKTAAESAKHEEAAVRKQKQMELAAAAAA